MEEKKEGREGLCNAPCITNPWIVHHLLFCEKESGHSAEHSVQMQDTRKGSKVVISWSYTGKIEDTSYAPPIDEHLCKERANVPLLIHVFPNQQEHDHMWRYTRRLLCISVSEHTKDVTPASFACEKSQNHDGGHLLNGTDTLGAKWRIEW